MADKNVKPVDDPFAILNEVEELGKVEESVKLKDGLSLIISTISAEEESEVFMNCVGFEGVSYITQNKIEVLAHSIKGINDTRFDYNKIEDPTERKKERQKVVEGLRNKIEGWRDEVVTFLYEKFLSITGNSEDQLKKLGLIANTATKKVLDRLTKDLENQENSEKKETKE